VSRNLTSLGRNLVQTAGTGRPITTAPWHERGWYDLTVESVLVAYGVPPNRVHLFSNLGRDLHTEWKFDAATFNGKTRQNFERLLRTALTSFLMNELPEITHADYRFIASASELGKALQSHRYTHVVYYGHAVDDGGTLKPLDKVSVRELQHVLQNSGVEQVDILGCRSMTFAAQLASALPKLAVGYLRGKRYDDIVVDMHTMQLTDFTVVPQTVFYFGPRPATK
jgi:hypothetical protein